MEPMPTDPPLCVDLDGTLVRSDLLIESTLVLLKRNPLYLLMLPIWLLRGKAHLKQQVADRADLDVPGLPYNRGLLQHLQDEKSRNRRLVLATASHRRYADQVASHTGLFDEVMATDATTNLAGSRKLERLRESFGEKGFDYAGNAAPDLKLWPHARRAILVDPTPAVRRSAEEVVDVERVFESPRSGPGTYLTLVRVHQWVKNLVLFVPLVLAHKANDLALLGQCAIAVAAFCLCSSSVYILNDLLDLTYDRRHPTKRERPMASGRIPVTHGIVLAPLLLAGSFALALLVPIQFVAILGCYYVATLSYSLWLRSMPMVDVLVLAGLYTLRLIAGAAAVAVEASFWLLAFSMFLFLSLALVKRYSELLAAQHAEQDAIESRGYRVVDLETLAQIGIASGCLAVVILALYINGDAVHVLYRHPQVIWLLCPFLLLWVGRIWLLTRRGEMNEDPVVFATHDRASYALALVGVMTLWLAT